MKTETKNRRVTVELSPMAAAEFDRLQEQTGLSTSELLRWSVTLMRIYVDSRADGKDIRVVNPRDPQDQARLELPLPMDVQAAPATTKRQVAGAAR